MDRETKIIINDACTQILGMFIKTTRIDKNTFNIIKNEVYKILLTLKDSKYIKLLDKELIRYVYCNDFLKYTKDPNDIIGFTAYFILYLDHDKKGNYIYHNMAKYIYFAYVHELKISSNKTLNYLLHCYHHVKGDITKSRKYTVEELQQILRFLVFVVTYLYMNDEILGEEIVQNKVFYKLVEIMLEDEYYDTMRLNGAFGFYDTRNEEDIKIYYIERAIEMLKEKEK